MINMDYQITMIRIIKNQAIERILKIKVQTIFKELGYAIEL
ncbi:hypothetical protein LX69_03360 [Breznakibacter xylanolyticus]|uniref:Uncharacterized protein n=1 Tax=Breznakibacter xylanolyticus TaxID=990 RepID=A0A2W7MRL2_9BACT|nr:hypothetical protein LX69_03360 [Breznakibacter xylanolyticus]